MPDKYTATWTSHTSISDFLTCPRAYYLKHVYKDPKTNHKVKLMTPALALGSAVHDALESLSNIARESRFDTPLMDRFHESWKKVTGKKGGFIDESHEQTFKRRGEEMMTRVYNNPGPIKNLSVKIQKDLPYFWLSEEDNIILCGRVDWLEYIAVDDSVHIIDFKTGKNKESGESLQLPIYYLLVNSSQKRKVTKASYWYLAMDDELTEMPLPNPDESLKKLLDVGRKMKLARQLERFKCPKGEDGCFACTSYEQILAGDAEFVGVDDFNYDVYIMPQKVDNEDDSIIL